MTPLPQLSDSEFRRVRRIVYDTSGIAITDSSRTLLSSRVRKRLKALQLASFGDYLRRLNGDPSGAELNALMDVISTKETSFFRTPAHFDWFANDFLGEQLSTVHRSRPNRELQIWSAACSTGEEPYSLAIILFKQQARLGGVNVRVFGSDISSTAIAQAQQGIFRKGAVSKLDASTKRFFAPAGPEEFLLREAIRQQVTFAMHNLMQPSPFQNLDCVFLRNVLIYFDQTSKDQVLAHAVDALRPGGYLVLGPSEGVFDIPPGLQRVQSFLFRRC